jgi:hypothetical protein
MRSRGCLRGRNHPTNRFGMVRDSADDFRIHLGRARSRGGPADTRLRPFVKQVEATIRKAGGNPNRIGSSAGKRSGRFNARGRGAKLSFPQEAGGWQRDSAGRFRARRVVVKARVVKLNPRRNQRQAGGPKLPGHVSRAADAHLRYLERDGVTRDGEKGHAYSALEDEADSRAFLARGTGQPAPVPLHCRSRGRYRAGRPARLHARPDAADRAGPGH